MKLVAKTPEERHQTAVVTECDLRRCLVEWNAQAWVDDFVLGQNDMPHRMRDVGSTWCSAGLSAHLGDRIIPSHCFSTA
jgi:hypothetical protein